MSELGHMGSDDHVDGARRTQPVYLNKRTHAGAGWMGSAISSCGDPGKLGTRDGKSFTSDEVNFVVQREN